VATRDVFKALGLRNGELLVGATDVLLQDVSWPEAGAAVGEWIAAFEEVGNDLEAPALKIQPVIGEVLSALGAADGARLARMSGSGATCFAIFEHAAEAQTAAEKIRGLHPDWWVHAGTLS
jgi:4-diphosphocytidyl-2-C-methyl-D-erythritol kinase